MKRVDGLEQLRRMYKDANKDYAAWESKYRIAIAQKILVLRTEGNSITLCKDLARGDEEIAKIRYNRDIKYGVMHAAKDAVFHEQTRLRIMQDQFNMEMRGS